jgi:hypothetical protein
MQVRLVVVSGRSKEPELLVTLPVVLGRGREATVRVPQALVSRRHCQLREADGYVVVQDMGSLNGTYIDNEPITEAVLPPGGLLTLGSLTFRAEYDPPAGPPAILLEDTASPPVTVAPNAGAPLAATNQPEFEDFELVDFEEDEPGK